LVSRIVVELAVLVTKKVFENEGLMSEWPKWKTMAVYISTHSNERYFLIKLS
jgi:hypothetical protein